MFDGARYVIIGSGFSGAVLAERIASVLGERVLVLDKRSHIGGNSYSALYGDTGIEYHCYGSHILHTRHESVWNYITGFCNFTGYRHHVMTEHAGKVYSMPISLDTINHFYGLALKPFEAENFIRTEAEKAGIAEPRNLEEKAISLIGKPLYEAFIKGYTKKQWNRNPRELPPEIITRLPVRANYNTCYFNDPWQGIPEPGYGALFARLLEHPNIEVRLETEYAGSLRHEIERAGDVRVISTGMIDQYFDYALGHLEWRSLNFEYEIRNIADYQGISVMNYADDTVPYTRVHEFKHYHPERVDIFESAQTVICREYPKDWEPGLEPYYPVNDAANQALYKKYKEKADASGVLFCGRLGNYTYSDMDVTIKLALDLFAEHIVPEHGKRQVRRG